MFNDDAHPFAPYLAIAMGLSKGLSKKNINFQNTIDSANRLAGSSREQIVSFLDPNNKELCAMYEALRTITQTCAEYHDYDNDEATPPYVYDDIPLNERLSNQSFLEIRNRAAAQLFNMNNLSMPKKVAVLTAFQLISKSNASRKDFGTAKQLEDFRDNACQPLIDKLYFDENGIRIEDAVKALVEKHKQQALERYLAKINAINKAAEHAYKELDEHYAKLLAKTVKNIEHKFEKARKKAIKKARRNITITIAAMAVTICVAPYLSAMIVEMAAIEAELAIMAIDALVYATVSTATNAVLKNDYNGIHKNFAREVAVGLGTGLTGYLASPASSQIAKGSTEAAKTAKVSTEAVKIAKGSTEAIKISAASSAVRSALQTALAKGKMDDILKSAVLGGASGALSEKLTAELRQFNAEAALGAITSHAMERALQTGVQSAIGFIGNKNANPSAWLLDVLSAAMVSYLSDAAKLGIDKTVEAFSEESTQSVDTTSTQPSSSPAVADQHVMLASQPSKQQSETSNTQSPNVSFSEKLKTKEVQAPPQKSSLQFFKPSVPSVSVGQKPSRNGLRLYDINNGRYTKWGQVKQNLVENNRARTRFETGITLTPYSPSPEQYRWQSGWQYGNEALTVNPEFVVNYTKPYFNSRFNPSTGQVNVEMYANVNAHLNIARGKSDVGLATLDYAFDAAGAYATANASVNTDRGRLTAGIYAGLGVLGPTANISAVSSNEYSMFGLVVSGEGTAGAGYGLAAEAGVGLTLDKTQYRLRIPFKAGLFCGWGAKVNGNPSIGLDLDGSAKASEEVMNQPERKMHYDSIKEVRARSEVSNPTGFFGKFYKGLMDQMLDEFESERYEIDGNIAAGSLSVRPVAK